MKKYDVVIIGAGIGGLICGCYLAKAKLKVLILEQHALVGGYCGSFIRKGYRFDVGVHYIGGLSGFTGKILREIGLYDTLIFHRFDPTDKIVMPDTTTYIRANSRDTIDGMKQTFPHQAAALNSFYDFIINTTPLELYRKTSGMTFNKLLSSFFTDMRLAATIETLLCNIGISAHQISAFAASLFFRDYVFDGGYYPEGGMQAFADAIAARFKSFGGELRLRAKVTELRGTHGNIDCIAIGNEKIQAKYVVSNADALHTFRDLLGSVPCKEKHQVEKMDVSPACFAVYAGIDGDMNKIAQEKCGIWYFTTYNVGSLLSHPTTCVGHKQLPYIMISFPSLHSPCEMVSRKHTVQIFMLAPYRTKRYWDSVRETLGDRMLAMADKVLPGLKQAVTYRITATPHTFERYTLNSRGSGFGWLSNIRQTDSRVFSQKTSLRNLMLAGHWTTMGSGQGGVPKVMHAGRNAARLIYGAMDMSWKY